MKYTCMSFNILGVDHAGNELYLPSEIRAEYIAKYLHSIKTDIVGIQEAGAHHRLYDWMTNFSSMISDFNFYDVVKIGDEEAFVKTTTTFSDKKVPLSAGLMILYRKDKFELIERGAHRYSSTEKQERYFQWVHLKDKSNGKDIFVTNTHWSINWDENGKVSKEAGAIHRTKQSNELREFWNNKVGNNVLFATGDYNCFQNSEWIHLAENDIYKQVETATDKDWALGDHIDNIFINPQVSTVEDLRFLHDKIDISSVKARHASMYFWCSSANKDLKLQFERMSDHEPLLVTVETK